jgi:hypothetical protein
MPSFDWNQYLSFAQDLDNMRDPTTNKGITCCQEAIDRCIVSRAYYAAFHHAKKYVESRTGQKFSIDNVHDEVSFWFFNHYKKGTFYDLREFRKWRNQCDYDDIVENFPKLIRDSRKTAGKIIHSF